MEKRTGTYNRIHGGAFRLTLATLILIFLLSPVSAALSEEEPWIAVIEKNENSVYFADHDESLTEGGWIVLSGGNEVRLPQPFNFIYNGTDRLESAGAALELKQGASDAEADNTEVVITYPYTTHPFYTEKDKVKVDYKGPAAFRGQKINVYLVRGLDPGSLGEAFTDFREENAVDLKEIFDSSTDSTTLEASVALDKKGDLPSSLHLGPLQAGSYGVLIMLAGDESEDPDPERKVLSATCFEVLEYDLKIDSPNKIEELNDLDISLNLKKAPDHESKKAPVQGSYTYGALLIREDAYRAEVNVSSDGTVEGTGIFVNGIDIINEFDINSTNYESKLHKDELTTEIQTLIGEGNGTITIGEENQDTLSLTAFDLPDGDYLLFAGAYEEGKGIVGVAQTELTIREAKKPKGPDKKQNLNADFSSGSQAPSDPETEQSALDTASSFGLEDLEPEIRAESFQTAAVLKNPPKLASFLIGFAGTLLIGITLMLKRKP